MNKKKLMDIFLFPKELYRRINADKTTLYLGILFIGIIDVILYNLPYFVTNFSNIFVFRPIGSLIFNISLLILSVIVIGILDVLFFSTPVFDLFKKMFKKDDTLMNNILFIRTAKVYITAHFLIVPISIIFYFILLSGKVNRDIIGLIEAFVIPIWFSAAITRGVRVVLGISEQYRYLIFGLVYLWNFFLVMALQYATDLVIGAFR
ncbi:MAG: hypothetical protein N2645_22435 [Clostridia bacterium]|nr:hypothetical protein [Clostridia bacterium]